MNARLILAVFVSLTVASVVSAADSARKPNVIVLLSDDAGYHEFSMHGSKTIATPRIDSIATNGVRFPQGYVSGCVCSPTRAGLMVGRYQQRFGHEFNIPPTYSETNGLSLAEKTLPQAMQAAGYRTIALGKWHLGYAPKFHPMERGFTDYYGFLQGQRSYWPLEKATQLNQLLRDREPVKPENFDYMTDELGRQAVAYFTKRKAEPFFMYVAFNATHGPLHATEADLKKVDGNKIAAMTIALDRAVGHILDGLEREGLLENTLVFFLNDNGGANGHDNAPLRGHKGSSWEGGIRVPFAMQWPARLPKGKVYESPVIQLDVFPTALAAAGVEATPAMKLDGVNLLPFLTGGAAGRPHETLYWKSGANWAVRDGDLKLTVGDGQTKTPALFDLSKDIGEQTDLAKDRPADVERLLAKYQVWAATHQPTPWGGKAEAAKEDAPKKKGKKKAEDGDE